MPKRYLFLDLLKAIALIEMIHGHTLDALLSPFQKSIDFWIFWQNIRGFTAPLFLFASGIAFAISTLKRKDYFYISKKFLNRIRRVIFITFLGYVLHLPYFSLRKTLFKSTLNDLNRFFNVDILQCIGVSILILQILYFISKNEKRFLKILGFVFINFYFLSICVNQIDLNLPLFFLKYFKNSLFPLTPYALYLFAGCISGFIFLKYKKNSVFIWICLISLIIFSILKMFSLKLEILFFRISVLSFISFLLLRFEDSKSKLLKFLQVFGKESLFVYFFHLPLIYGSAFNKGLRFYISGKLRFFEVYLVFLSLFFAFFLLSFLWNYLKENKKDKAYKIKYLLYISFLTAFVLRPY